MTSSVGDKRACFIILVLALANPLVASHTSYWIPAHIGEMPSKKLPVTNVQFLLFGRDSWGKEANILFFHKRWDVFQSRKEI